MRKADRLPCEQMARLDASLWQIFARIRATQRMYETTTLSYEHHLLDHQVNVVSRMYSALLPDLAADASKCWGK